MASHQVPLVSETLGHYRIVEKIGAGGMGEVYRATDEHLARDVAIKVLPPGTLADASARKHFRLEALALSKLNHPNIATIYDFDTQQGLDFLVMEYIAGETLNSKLAKGSLAEKEVLRLGLQLSEGLEAAHSQGIIHRDLKPSNLRLTSDGRLKILDFGLAKLRRPLAEGLATESTTMGSLGDSQVMAGTLPYMAPEQLVGGAVDARTDVHAVGCVLYEMATGQRPFTGVARSQMVAAILHRPPILPTVVNPRLSSELERIIGKCLEKEPEERYQSTKELSIDLQRLMRETYSSFSSTGAHPGHSTRRPVSKWLGFALLMVSILFLAVLADKFWHKGVKGGSPGAATASIAVLPFADLSPGHDQEYFSDGLAEELLNQLTKIPNLRVAARTSAFRFKGQNEDLRVIGKRLNVTNVLEGTVRKEGNRVRISAQLIRVDDGFNLWSDSYDRDLTDVFVVQDDIARAATSALQLKLRSGDSSFPQAASGTTNPQTYEAFLHARYFAHMNDKEFALRALDYADKAIQFDPNYAPAYALRAAVNMQAAGMLWVKPTEATEKARRDTEKAITLDPNLADAYRVVSHIQAEAESNCREAESSLDRARELAPGDPDNLAQGAMLAICQGRQEEAIELFRRELVIDPLRPSEYMYLAQVLRDVGRYDEAHVALGKALELNPNQIMVHEVRGEVYLAQGRPVQALAEMEKEPESIYRDLGRALAYHTLAQPQASDAALAHLISQYQNDGAYQIAQMYGYRGDVDQAFAWLDRAYAQHDPGLEWIKTDLKFRSIRKDPRFAQLLRKLNLPA